MKLKDLAITAECTVFGGNGLNDNTPTSAAVVYVDMDFKIDGGALGIIVPYLYVIPIANGGAVRAHVQIVKESQRGVRPQTGRITLANGGAPNKEPDTDNEANSGIHLPLITNGTNFQTQGAPQVLSRTCFVPKDYFLRAYAPITGSIIFMKFLYIPVYDPCMEIPI